MTKLLYNTALPRLIIPEYGRHIQKMVDHCMTIEDREERTRCAYAIAEALKSHLQNNINEKDAEAKVWDHLYAMSKFQLDIDFPVEVAGEEDLHPHANGIPYSAPLDRFRHYGRSTQRLLKLVADMENCVEKDKLIFLIANQMKKLLVNRNTEIATDLRIFNDIKEITNGRIDINPENYRLNDYIGVSSPEANKKKKKNKN